MGWIFAIHRQGEARDVSLPCRKQSYFCSTDRAIEPGCKKKKKKKCMLRGNFHNPLQPTHRVFFFCPASSVPKTPHFQAPLHLAVRRGRGRFLLHCIGQDVLNGINCVPKHQVRYACSNAKTCTCERTNVRTYVGMYMRMCVCLFLCL